MFVGIESFSKLGDSIYFEEQGEVPSLYIIQYVSSSLNWKAGGTVINQKIDALSSWDPYLRATFTFSSEVLLTGQCMTSRQNFTCLSCLSIVFPSDVINLIAASCAYVAMTLNLLHSLLRSIRIG